MQENSIRAVLGEFRRELGLSIDTAGDGFALEIEAAGKIDVAISPDDQRAVLRARIIRADSDHPALLAAMEINALPVELGGAVLGFDREEGWIVLSRVITARQCGRGEFSALLSHFAGVVAAVLPKLRDAARPATTDTRFEMPADNWLRG